MSAQISSTGVQQAGAMPMLGRLPEVKIATGLGRSSIYKMMKDGTFPIAVHITQRTVAWRMDEVADWINSRPRITPADEQ